MERRSFFQSLAALGAVPFAPYRDSAPLSGKISIRDIEFWRLEGERETIRGLNRQYQAQPLHIYPEHRPEPYRDAPNPEKATVGASALYLKILTDAGLEGLYGPIDTEAAVVVDRQLRNFLKGKDPLAVETLWDQMYRSNRHSRASHFMMAISAVDNALWDLRGRYYNAPVYRLLGGPTRSEAEVYGSCLGYSVEPEPARRKSAELKSQGFRCQKWFLPYGPGSGGEGLIKNVELARILRESLGDDAEIMFDAFMGWDYYYALSWAKQVEQYRPYWIEEAFPPDRLESFVELSKKTSIPVATGEHFYGRWEVHEFLKADAIRIVQADPEWCGGVSELVKICTLASVHDVHVVPHGHSLHAALHVVASQSPITCPLVEYLFTKMDNYYQFEQYQLKPVNGKIRLPERPGFGIEFDDSRIQDMRKVSWS